jgi:hypothetical protein
VAPLCAGPPPGDVWRPSRQWAPWGRPRGVERAGRPDTRAAPRFYLSPRAPEDAYNSSIVLHPRDRLHARTPHSAGAPPASALCRGPGNGVALPSRQGTLCVAAGGGGRPPAAARRRARGAPPQRGGRQRRPGARRRPTGGAAGGGATGAGALRVCTSIGPAAACRQWRRPEQRRPVAHPIPLNPRAAPQAATPHDGMRHPRLVFPHTGAFQGPRGRPPLSTEDVLTLLSGQVSESRLERLRAVVGGRCYGVLPVIEGLHDVGNMSAVCRSADGARRARAGGQGRAGRHRGAHQQWRRRPRHRAHATAPTPPRPRHRAHATAPTPPCPR